MNEDTARSILRLIAVVTMLVGAILTVSSVVLLVGASRSIAASGVRVDVTGALAEVGLFAILAYVTIVVEGALLWFLSPMLAAKVVE